MREARKQFYEDLSRRYSRLIRLGYDKALLKRAFCKEYGLSPTQLYTNLHIVELDTYSGEDFNFRKILAEIDGE